MLIQFHSPSWLNKNHHFSGNKNKTGSFSGVNTGANTTEDLCNTTNSEDFVADINVMDTDNWSLDLTQNFSHNNPRDSCQVRGEQFNTYYANQTQEFTFGLIPNGPLKS